MAMLSRVSVRAALLVALAAIVWARGDFASAQAQPPRSLREAMVGSVAEDGRNRDQAPPVARYRSETGASFVFDRSGRTPLLQFDQGLEIWALHPTPGPRGDIIYKNDLEQAVVRTTRLGGLTLFTQEHPEGMPAALVGEARAFRPPAYSPAQVLQLLAHASSRASRSARHVVPFEAGVRGQEVTAQTAYLVADAAGITAEALYRLSLTPRGRVALTRVLKVKILYGPRATARLKDGVLEVIISPRYGMAGRPSSGVIMRTISAR
jgi:hypothetical protein